MNEDEQVQCPYNKAHIILKHRMAAHLIKCRQQHPTVDFTQCPFNAAHDVPTCELEYHVENCSDKRKLQSLIYVEQDIALHSNSNIHTPVLEENWDEGPYKGQSYLETKNQVLESAQVLRIPVGMSKSKRKKFFSNEVEKFQSMTGQSTSEIFEKTNK